MMAMQYTIPLPSGYPPERIHQRVEERRPLFVGREGLKHKSYLFNAEDSIYAPFYLWENESALTGFLLDDLFSGVVESFSRPRVRSWQVLHCWDGGEPAKARFARRESDPIPAEANIRSLVEKEWAEQTAMRVHGAMRFHLIALDPDRWEIIRYSEWDSAADAPPPHADCIQNYQILDVWRNL